MSPSGDRSGETAERIREAWRQVHPAAHGPEQTSGGPPSTEEPIPPLERPDRSCMDPIMLDRVTARQRANELRRKSRNQIRRWKALRIDRWLQRSLLLLAGVTVAGGVFWILKVWKKPHSRGSVQAPVQVPAKAADRALKMLQAFLAAPDAAAKSAYVLDAARVKPLMEAAYRRGGLPEPAISLGVPQTLDGKVLAVPALVSGPAEFLLHLMVKEVNGELRLDWETYEQEMSQRFQAFTGRPGTPAADFRLVLERTHSFGNGPGAPLTVRVATPGSAALVNPIAVHPEAAAGLTTALPWNRPRRALVRLEWEMPPDGAPRIILREVVRWDFMP